MGILIDMGEMDWRMLRQQKRILAGISGLKALQAATVEGLLAGLDHIQDEAAKQLGEEAVFGTGDHEEPLVDELAEAAKADLLFDLEQADSPKVPVPAAGQYAVEPEAWSQGGRIVITSREVGILAVIENTNENEQGDEYTDESIDWDSAERKPWDIPNAFLFAAAPALKAALLKAQVELETYWQGDHEGRPLAKEIADALASTEVPRDGFWDVAAAKFAPATDAEVLEAKYPEADQGALNLVLKGEVYRGSEQGLFLVDGNGDFCPQAQVFTTEDAAWRYAAEFLRDWTEGDEEIDTALGRTYHSFIQEALSIGNPAKIRSAVLSVSKANDSRIEVREVKANPDREPQPYDGDPSTLTEADFERWPKDDWQHDVVNGDTKLGYEAWVLHNLATAEDEVEELEGQRIFNADGVVVYDGNAEERKAHDFSKAEVGKYAGKAGPAFGPNCLARQHGVPSECPYPNCPPSCPAKMAEGKS